MDTSALEEHFNSLHTNSNDPWNFWSSKYESKKYYQQIAAIKSFVQPCKILELGCSTGAHTEKILQEFPDAEIVAIDISEKAVEIAKRNIGVRSNVKFIISEMSHFLSKNTEQFDAIFWSEGFDELSKTYTFDRFYSLIDDLYNSTSNQAILCISHITAKDGKSDNLSTTPEILESYHKIVGRFFNRVQESAHKSFKEETQKHYDYTIRLYKPKPNYDRVHYVHDVLRINKVDVVIPARDESETIGKVVSTLKLSKYVDRVIVVDNDSADSTGEDAESAGAEVIKCLPKGYGAALKKGLSYSEKKYIVKVDGDIQNPNHKWVNSLIDCAIQNNNPFIKTCWRPTLEDPDRVTNFTVKPLFKSLFPELLYLKSPLSGIYLLDKEIIAIDFLPNDFAFDVALLLEIHAKYGRCEQIEIESVMHGAISNQKRTLDHYFSMSERISEYLIKKGFERV